MFRRTTTSQMMVILSSCLCVAAASLSVEAQVQRSKDWSLTNESSDPYLGVPSCRVSSSRAEPIGKVYLSLSFPKEKLKAPVAMITIRGEAGDRIKLLLKTAESSIALPLKNYKSDAGTSFWYLPTHLGELISHIQNANILDLEMESDAGVERLRISLAGSTRIFQAARECLGTTDLYFEEFFSQINDKTVQPQTVNGMISSDRLQEVTEMAYSFYLAIKELSEEKSELISANRENIDLEQIRLGEFEGAEKEYLGSTKRLKDLKVEEQTLVEGIKLAESNLIVLREQKDRKSVEVKELQSRYEPLNKQHVLFQTKLNNLKNQSAALKKKIESAEQASTLADAKIQTFLNENNQIIAQVTDLNSKVQVKGDESALIASELNSFMTESQIQSRLQLDSTYTSTSQQLESMKSQLPPLEASLGVAQTAQLSAQREFEQCRRESLANDPAASAAVVCQTQMSSLQQAQSQQSSAQRQVRELNSSVSRLELKLREIQLSVRAVVLAERAAIQSRLDIANNELQALQQKVKGLASRQELIATKEIPTLQNQVELKMAEIQKSADELTVTLTEIEKTQLELQSFLATTNFDSLKSQHSKNLKDLAATEQREAALITQIESQKKRQVQRVVEEGEVSARLPDQQTRFEMAKSELSVIQGVLVNFKKKEQILDQGLETLREQYNLARGYYRFIFEQIGL